ncbi:MAG: HNH endonuclease [Candidatus Methanoperedens sp.]
MTVGRNKREQDRDTTRKLILNPNRPKYFGGENWLGHGVRGGRDAYVDEMLLDGATMKELRKQRSAIYEHLSDLRVNHGLLYERVGDKYRFNRADLGINDNISQPFKSDFRIADEDEALTFAEGKELYRMHRSFERNPALASLAKERKLAYEGDLLCEVCGVSFRAFYVEYGAGYIEAHHVIPVSQMKGEAITRIEDIALLCSNCHRVIHRVKPLLSVQELKKIVSKSMSKKNL